MQKLPEGDTPKINEYYERISKKLRNMKYVMILLMVVALIFTLWAYRNRLTYDNFRYLLRDMDEAGNTVSSSDSLFYSANDTNNYVYFKGDLAVASSEGVALHRALSNRSFEDKVAFRNPSVATSGKYMVVYDCGGKTFYVYNSISRIYSETLEREIISCAAADNGNFAVLTKNNIGGHVVRLYNKDFKLAGEITREGYAYAINFFDGEHLGIYECYSDGVSIATDFLIYTYGSEDIEKSVSVGGLLMDAKSVKNGYFLLCDSGITFFDKEWQKISYNAFGTSDIMYADSNDNYVAVLLDENKIGADCGVYLYSPDGLDGSAHIPSGAKGIALCSNRSVVLYDGKLTVINGDDVSDIEIAGGGRRIISQSKDSVLVCYNDYAKIFEVK